jgi:hypothetical protein
MGHKMGHNQMHAHSATSYGNSTNSEFANAGGVNWKNAANTVLRRRLMIEDRYFSCALTRAREPSKTKAAKPKAVSMSRSKLASTAFIEI